MTRYAIVVVFVASCSAEYEHIEKEPVTETRPAGFVDVPCVSTTVETASGPKTFHAMTTTLPAGVEPRSARAWLNVPDPSPLFPASFVETKIWVSVDGTAHASCEGYDYDSGSFRWGVP